MGLFAKPILQWKEPPEYERLRYPTTTLLQVSGFIVSSAVLFCFCLALPLSFPPKGKAPSSLGKLIIGVAVYVVVVQAISLVNARSRFDVEFTDNGVSRHKFSVKQPHPSSFWVNYSDIASWRLTENVFHQTKNRMKTIRVLELKLKNRETRAMGVAETIKREQIAQVFKGKNIAEAPAI